MKLGLYSISAACLLAIAVLAAGCGSDSDTLTLDEYFAEFAAIDDDVDAQFEEVFLALFPEDVDDETFFEDEANLPVILEAISAFPRITAEILDRATELDPPSEVEDAHNDLLAALEDLSAAMEEGNDALQDTETLAEFEELESELGPTLIDPAQARLDEACLAVVAIGEDNGISVSSISCEDD